MRPQGGMAQMQWPRPGRALIALLAINIVAYIVELVLFRANVTFVRDLFLTPADVFERGQVWQIFTYWWLHAPDAPGHLLFNMLFLWMFGSPLERSWGEKRFVGAYLIFGLGGSALTLLVGLLSQTDVLMPLLGSFWLNPHVGASGAVMGMTVAWALVNANQTINFLFLGAMKGRTFLWITIAVQLLYALSLDPTSSTSHFGGMIAAWVLCRGMWRPSRWRDLFKRADLERKKKKIEDELRVISGGKSPPKNPRDWN